MRRFRTGASLASRVCVLLLCAGLSAEPLSKIGASALLRGDQALAKNQFDLAITEYQIALAAQPRDPAILDRLVVALLATHRTEQAYLYLRQRVLVSINKNSSSLQQTANILASQGETEQASAYLLASFGGPRLASTDLPILKTLIDYQLNGGDWDTAIKLLSRLINAAPGDNQALYQLGLLLAPTDATSATTYLDRAAIDPKYQSAASALRVVYTNYGNAVNATVAFQVGLALMNLKAWPFAEHALALTVSQAPSNAPALAFLGVVQDQQGRDGWPAIEKAFVTAPTDPLVNYAAALHWRLAGNSNRALASLVRAQALDPRNPAIAAEIGLVYQMQGRLSDAALWLNIATTLAPQQAGFRTLLANFYADSHYNLAGEGLTAIRRLADQSPNDADVRASLGWALFATGQFVEARVQVEKALTLDPTNIRARYYFGIILENQSDPQGAVAAYLYVFRNGESSGFRDLAAGALERMGYRAGS